MTKDRILVSAVPAAPPQLKQNRKFGPCLMAIDRILTSVVCLSRPRS
jgi:hypothetical protein